MAQVLQQLQGIQVQALAAQPQAAPQAVQAPQGAQAAQGPAVQDALPPAQEVEVFSFSIFPYLSLGFCYVCPPLCLYHVFFFTLARCRFSNV